MRRWHRLALTLVVALTSCGGGSDAVRVDVSREPPRRLSDFKLFTWDPSTGFTFNEGVVPYDLNTALFSDYALKQRAIYIPEGSAATFDPENAFDLPVGSVVIKSFYFPADFRAPTENLTLVETRLLIHYPDGWRAYPYIWDAQQRDAVLSPSGEVRRIDFVDPHGESRSASYLVPQRNQCVSCHARKVSPDADAVMSLIGVKARHLDRDYDYGGEVGLRNQLTHFAELGMLEGLPSLDTITSAYDFRAVEATGVAAIPEEDLDFAARSYLDINCAHCHSPTGVQGITSQLFLNHDNTDTFRLGYCKRPGSAGAGTGGFTFDILPGNAEESILYFRTHTEEVGAMMPLIGRSVTHTQGADLVRRWIDSLPAQTCESD